MTGNTVVTFAISLRVTGIKINLYYRLLISLDIKDWQAISIYATVISIA